MKKINVGLKDNSYDIIIGSGLLEKSGLFIRRLKIGNFAYIITNHIINKNFGWMLKRSLKERKIEFISSLLDDNERAKSIYVAIALIKGLLKYKKKKNPFIVALGGGVIGDLAGFVASIYKRGIPYIQIPTTLLGQIDSGIGGKTAVDLKEAKNLIGTFYQPALVLNDVSLLKTLNSRQLRSGLAEAIKYGVIWDGFILTYIERYLKEIFAYNEDILKDLVYQCAKIKAKIVEIDEKEKKMLRTILNFGHTIGHAVEAGSGYRIYTHGEAIGIGMLIALKIGIALGITRPNLNSKVEQLMQKIGLPTKITKRLPLEKIIDAYYYDKKFRGAENRFVLIKDIGKPVIKENIPLGLIKTIIKQHY